MAKARQAPFRNLFRAAYEEPADRTSQLVTLGNDGDFMFLGCRDGMVKTCGDRVELGEIEPALYQHPVGEAVVLAAPDDFLSNRTC